MRKNKYWWKAGNRTGEISIRVGKSYSRLMNGDTRVSDNLHHSKKILIFCHAYACESAIQIIGRLLSIFFFFASRNTYTSAVECKTRMRGVSRTGIDSLSPRVAHTHQR